MSQGYVLTILNLKGGVGKTHATWLLASVAHERSLPLLAIDLDTQGNLTTSFATEERSERGVAALFDPAADDDPATLTQKTPFACIDLIPSSPKLARFDLSDQKVWEKTDSHLALLDAAKISAQPIQVDHIRPPAQVVSGQLRLALSPAIS